VANNRSVDLFLTS